MKKNPLIRTAAAVLLFSTAYWSIWLGQRNSVSAAESEPSAAVMAAAGLEKSDAEDKSTASAAESTVSAAVSGAEKTQPEAASGETASSPEETEQEASIPVSGETEEESGEEGQTDASGSRTAAGENNHAGDSGNGAVTRREILSEYDWLAEHADLFSDGKVDMAGDNPDLIHFMFTYAKGEYEIPADQKFTEEETAEAVPALYQWDGRWGYDPYGDSVIGLSGCGPTALSMVAAGLTGNASYTPAYVADYAQQNGWYVNGTGTSWALITRGAGDFGLSVREVGKDERAVLRELDEGHPVILSLGPGMFTNTGHYLVLTEETDGLIRIHDPNSRQFTGGLWKFDTLSPMIRNIWAFSRR
ncbi:MAG: C39 family peptidase [Lachnospiraceae bacterium]|nr:C39 family peptidase [Lachnospiraceae bacterium]MDY6335424.1 C39 family peptidase [Lachnospiraceae bacterium]